MYSKLAEKESEKQMAAKPSDGSYNARVSSLYGYIQQNTHILGCFFSDVDTGADFVADIQKSQPRDVQAVWMEKIVFSFINDRTISLRIQNGEIISTS